MRSKSDAKTAGSKLGRARQSAYHGRVLVDKTSCNSEEPTCSLPEMFRSLIRHSRLGSSSSTGMASNGEERRKKKKIKAERMPYPDRRTGHLQRHEKHMMTIITLAKRVPRSM